MPIVYPVMNPAATAPNPPSQAIEQLRQLSFKKSNPNRLTEREMGLPRNDAGPFPNPLQGGTPYSRNRC
jgi:hypothetical protein